MHYYNTKRLHSAIGYITPRDKLEAKEGVIFAERDRKLHDARERRRQRRMEVKADCQRAVAQVVTYAS